MSERYPFSRWQAHPWHGNEPGPKPPQVVSVYVEITPFDQSKYELDKVAGFVRVDRPQRTSSLPPALYGFIPRTFCADRVAALTPTARGGDGDPLDICVISERPINRSEVILNANVIGGIQLVDDGEADDKIISVLVNDSIWGKVEDISDLPPILDERLRHYFATSKLISGEPDKIVIGGIYGREHAFKVVEASIEDYKAEWAQE
jgi:inorganic pyrophosphatase